MKNLFHLKLRDSEVTDSHKVNREIAAGNGPNR